MHRRVVHALEQRQPLCVVGQEKVGVERLCGRVGTRPQVEVAALSAVVEVGPDADEL